MQNTKKQFIYYKYKQEEINGHFVATADRNGFLFDQDFNLTEFKAADLPECFIYGIFEYGAGYLDSSGVKGLSYIHCCKGDFLEQDVLLVSYHTDNPTTLDYDSFVRGNDILSFLRGANRNSDYHIFPFFLQIQHYLDEYNEKKKSCPYSEYDLHVALFGFPLIYREMDRYKGNERLMRYVYETEQMRLREIEEHNRQLAEWRRMY